MLDRIGRRVALLTAYAGFAIGTFACGLAGSYVELVVARAATGLFGGVLGTVVLAIVGDVFPGPQRGRAMGVVMSAFATASTIGVPLGLELAHRGGRGLPFLAIGAVAALAWVVGWRTLPALRGHLDHAVPTDLLGVLRRPAVGWAFVFMGCIIVSGFLVIPFLADSMTRNCGMPKDRLRWIYLVSGAATMVSTNVVGWAADRFGKALVFRTMATAAAGMALAFTHLGAMPFAGLLLVTTAFMVTMSGRMVPAQALVVGCVPPAVRGAFLSMMTALQHGMMGAAGLVSGRIVQDGTDGRLEGFGTVGFLSAGIGLLALAAVGRLPVAAPPGFAAAGAE